MVIGHGFAWGHLPKTGGNATLALFDLFPHLIVSADPRDSRLTHTYFRERKAEVEGKQLALGIRRLPSWLLSRALYRTRHGAYPDYVPLPMESPHQMAESSYPDRVLRSFTNEGRFHIDSWLRMECLESDFLDFISQFTEVDDAQKRRITKLGRVMTEDERRRGARSGNAEVQRVVRGLADTAAGKPWAVVAELLGMSMSGPDGEAFEVGYDSEISHWFTEGQIRRMYESNPVWSAVERSVYGVAPLSLTG